MINRTLAPSEIVKICAKYFDIEAVEIFSNRRHQDLVTARFATLYFLKRYTKLTLRNIGALAIIYGRPTKLKHCSVIHGIKKFNELSLQYKEEKEMVKHLVERIEWQIWVNHKSKGFIIEDINLLSMCRV